MLERQRAPRRAAPLAQMIACALVLAASAAACDDLGPGSGNPGQQVPTPPEGFPRFVQISVGINSACGLTADSTALCWGASMLSPGSVYHFVPTPANIPKLGQMSVGPQLPGWDTLCGTTSAATVVCWGALVDATLPVTVPNSSGLSAIVVGAAACGLDAAGAAHCWTYTDLSGVHGLPVGSPTPVIRGTPIQVETAQRFVALASNYAHACGVTAAGEAWCWGYDQAFNLGSGGPGGIAHTPVRVATDETVAAITTGQLHSCALTTDGRALCWGFAHRGILGRPGAPTVECPDVLLAGIGPAPCVPLPGPVAGGITFASISAGGHHTCGLDLEGRAWCWGSGAWGEIGNGSSGTASAPNLEITPQPVVGNLRFRSLVAGQFLTCGIAADNATYCWGSNHVGQLGSGRAQGYVATVPHPVGEP